MPSSTTSTIFTVALTATLSTVLTAVLVFTGSGAFAQKAALTMTDFSAAFYAEESPMQSCGSQLNSTSLPTSSTYQASDWEAAFRMDYNSTASMPREQMIDLNGDGLVDYQYVYTTSGNDSSGGYYTYSSCVYLNTGSGFTVAHLCSASIRESDGIITSQTYIGDCAG